MGSIIDEIREKIANLEHIVGKIASGDHMVVTVGKDSLTLLSDIRTLCEEQNAIINARLNIPVLNRQMTYAEAIKKTPESTTVLVYPKEDTDKENSSSDQTLANLKKQLNPIELSIDVEKTRFIRNAGVAVTVSNKKDAEKLSSTLKRCQYDCKIQNKRNPFVKLHGVSTETTDRDIQRAIVRASCDFLDDDDVSVQENNVRIIRRGKYRDRNDISNVFLQVQPSVWEQLMFKKSISIQWQKISVSNHTPVTRCFNCQAYGHHADKCQSKTACSHFGGKHETRSCRFIIKTGLCVNSLGIEGNDKANCNHAAYSNQYPIYQKMKRRVEDSISYPICQN